MSLCHYPLPMTLNVVWSCPVFIIINISLLPGRCFPMKLTGGGGCSVSGHLSAVSCHLKPSTKIIKKKSPTHIPEQSPTFPQISSVAHLHLAPTILCNLTEKPISWAPFHRSNNYETKPCHLYSELAQMCPLCLSWSLNNSFLQVRPALLAGGAY